MNGHLDKDRLIEFQEGFLSHEDSLAVKHHLINCRRCRRLYRKLSQYSQSIPTAFAEPSEVPEDWMNRMIHLINKGLEDASIKRQTTSRTNLEEGRAPVNSNSKVRLSELAVKAAVATLNTISSFGSSRNSVEGTLKRLYKALGLIKMLQEKTSDPNSRTMLRLKQDLYIETAEILDLFQSHRESITVRKQALFCCRMLGNQSKECSILRELGVSHFKLGEYKEGLEFFIQALNIAKRKGLIREVCSNMRNIGCVYNRLGDYNEAVSYFERAVKLGADKITTQDLILDLHNLSIGYRRKGEYDRAIQYCHKALDLEREIGDRLGQAYSLVSLSNIHADLGDHWASIKYCREALEIFEERGIDREAGMCLFNIGNSLNELEQPAEALRYFERSMELKRRSNDQAGIIYNLVEMGRAYRALKDPKRALECHKKAEAAVGFVSSIYLRSEIKAQLAQDFYELKQYEQAIEYAQAAINAAKQCGDDRMLLRIYLQLARVYLSKNDHNALRQIYESAKKLLQGVLSRFENNKMRESFLLSERGIDLFNFDYNKFILGLKSNI